MSLVFENFFEKLTIQTRENLFFVFDLLFTSPLLFEFSFKIYYFRMQLPARAFLNKKEEFFELTFRCFSNVRWFNIYRSNALPSILSGFVA